MENLTTHLDSVSSKNPALQEYYDGFVFCTMLPVSHIVVEAFSSALIEIRVHSLIYFKAHSEFQMGLGLAHWNISFKFILFQILWKPIKLKSASIHHRARSL